MKLVKRPSWLEARSECQKLETPKVWDRNLERGPIQCHIRRFYCAEFRVWASVGVQGQYGKG